MWTGEEALYIPKGQFGEMFPRITWQDAPSGGDPGGASLRGDPAAASCQALSPSSAEAYRHPQKGKNGRIIKKNMEYGHYEITIKETYREKPVSTEYHGFINHEGLVSFFGLKEPDVEWYNIREITGQQEENPEGSRRDETRIGRFPPGPSREAEKTGNTTRCIGVHRLGTPGMEFIMGRTDNVRKYQPGDEIPYIYDAEYNLAELQKAVYWLQHME